MNTGRAADLQDRSIWRDRRILDLFGIDLPIVQAPMAGATASAMAIEVSNAGGLGSLPCALMTPEQAGREVETIRAATDRPINLNFFCHVPPPPDETAIRIWRDRLSAYYAEYGLKQTGALPTSSPAPFDETYCRMIEVYRPPVVSFHFGLPTHSLVSRVKAAGAKVISSATTVAEARWLEKHGADAIIAMGAEAGGHQGSFLNQSIVGQIGTFALVPQVVDAVSVPVIAAGGIADGRGIAAALILGAAAAQIGTAYLFTPEATIKNYHRTALRDVQAEDTALTNVFTGRPARAIMNRLMREVGPMSDLVPAFPFAGGALVPLRAKTEPDDNGDFSGMWCGEAARLAKEMPAGELTRHLALEGWNRLQQQRAVRHARAAEKD